MKNVAVFGAGRIGRIHATNLAAQPGVRLKYVCDALPAGSEPAAQGRNGTGMRIPPTPYARATGSNPVGSASQTRASGEAEEARATKKQVFQSVYSVAPNCKQFPQPVR